MAEGDGGGAGSRTALGPALRRAWIGYQRRLTGELTQAGFADRSLPDGRVLRICSRGDDVTISDIGRQLGITRQGAGKIVASLRERGYVTVDDSPVSARAKIVRPTTRATTYLAAQKTAARAIERRLRNELGDDTFEALERLLAALDDPAQPRLLDYLNDSAHLDI
ncbi:MAG TPA: MarR family winged helix-turn-helix transcriptional regulator [Stackebrandtia sp.]|jgi:DNA-binding MarR family transcriptional regulator|uniref:MarR family winged helix-turn-helix transcriptional regulator n=1 Tax=Stackebrandtia sp. TaxID=2023065 RepID=UPI002D510A45|nr:MarR family winged helix-turn-helix transcriptional regulator [Stackebrandtia sp.]HZE40681.1 MarR family winged helix-turn-helix transcriptional regulator [Stackebrandtia sp.]